MDISRNRMLPQDLKSYSRIARNKNLIEGVRTIAAAILMAAMFMVVVFAGVYSDPVDYPVITVSMTLVIALIYIFEPPQQEGDNEP